MNAAALHCPDCPAPMVLRTSARGPFYGCAAFPACRGTRRVAPDGSPAPVPRDQPRRAARPDPLWVLREALRDGTAESWAREHAPDGDADAAVRRAWDAPATIAVLCDVLTHAGHPPAATQPYFNAAVGLGRGSWRERNADEMRVCDALRRAFCCPTWAELTRAA